MKRRKLFSFFLSFLILFSLFSVVAYAASGDTIVYRTKTGSCYHTKNCSYLKSSIEITLKEAVNKGLKPCSRCHPPTLDSKNNSSVGSKAGASVSGVFGTGTKFEVTITANCLENNSVGNDWSQIYSIDGDVIESGDIIAFDQNDLLRIKTKITEYDANKSDVGTQETSHKVTASDISKGFSIKQTITVKENDGKYKGHTATWEVVYEFSRD